MTRLPIHLHKTLYTPWENLTYGPYLITGRKYIHFNGGDRRKGDIYWFSAKIIEELRPKEQK